MQTRAQVMTEHDERISKPVGVFQQQVAPGVLITYQADRILDRAGNAGHETLLIDNAHFGRLMFVDGVLRSSSADEFIYHEMMSHVPIFGFIGTHYYTPEVHRAAFALPQFLRNTITAATRPDEEVRVVRPFLQTS
jgi:spermidine synthase